MFGDLSEQNSAMVVLSNRCQSINSGLALNREKSVNRSEFLLKALAIYHIGTFVSNGNGKTPTKSDYLMILVQAINCSLRKLFVSFYT